MDSVSRTQGALYEVFVSRRDPFFAEQPFKVSSPRKAAKEMKSPEATGKKSISTTK